ncbi:hypothetical protein Sjap_015038 [Stephania japonica]|uniref:Uncharacterized protein n=1 Tax=Stephania japonica TaxID=461633 RepID=A0AAP0IID4_9MAGN
MKYSYPPVITDNVAEATKINTDYTSSAYPDPVLPSAPIDNAPISSACFEYPPPLPTSTTLKDQQTQMVMTRNAKSPLPWSTGLCDCCSDISSCCLTCWCPCVTFGRIAEIVDRGSTSCGVSGALYTLILCVTGCACMYSCFYRSKLRGQYFLEEGPCTCTDCCLHCCCEECALCQEYRELQNRGFDMSIGWHANMERQKIGQRTPPEVQGEMKR